MGRGRGRPKGSKNKATIEREKLQSGQLVEAMHNSDRLAHYTDEQVIEIGTERFQFLSELATGLINGHFRGATISGDPGIGKSYNLNAVLSKAAASKTNPIKFTSYSGAVTPVNLFKLLYMNRAKNAITVFDDCDSVFFDDDSINLLKAALDNKGTRTLSWFSERKLVNKDSGEEIPSQFDFEGGIFFVTNLDFDAIIERGAGRIVEHLKAFQSRTMYLDLAIHHRRHLTLWVQHIAKKTRMLQLEKGLTPAEETLVMNFFRDNSTRLRTVDLRTLLNLASLLKTSPTSWQRQAQLSMFKGLA